MKRVYKTSFLFVIVLSLLLASFGGAKAAIDDDPVVTPVSGDMEFTTEVVPIASLPGTIELADLMLAPTGFPEGEAQFEGSGVMISGMDSGKATACFAVSGTQWGWGGKVGMWDGTKWVLLSTSITKAEEALNSLACATVTGNGTYAFIKYVAEPDKLPAGKPACWQIGVGWGISLDNHLVTGGMLKDYLHGYFTENENSWVTYQIIDYSEGVTGDLNGYTSTDGVGFFDFTPSSWFVPTDGFFTIHLETPACYFDWFFDESD